jgi:hypothetical protein
MARLSGGCMTAARWVVARLVGIKRRLSGNITAPRWMVAVIVTMVSSVLVPGWITMMLLLESVESISNDLEAAITAVERNQVCLLQELHVEPSQRGPQTLERFSACPNSLPSTSVP